MGDVTDVANMFLPDGRVDPSPALSLPLKQQYIGEFRDWLGEKWLDGADEHPVRSLWRRRDRVATTELLTIGHAISRIKANASAWMQAAAKTVRGADTNNAYGAIFELFAASMFDHPKHPVTLGRKSEPGFDFAVRVPGGVLRVSCKALQPSDVERRFVATATEIHDQLVPHIRSHTTTVMFLEEKDPYAQDPSMVAYHASLVHGSVNDSALPLSVFKVGWEIGITAIRPPRGARFWRGKPSYTFIAVSEFLTDEQRRFDAKVREAADGFRKAVAPDGIAVANVALIKVPASISMKQAEVYVNQLFTDPSMAHLGSVMVSRTRFGKVLGDDDLHLLRELRQFINPLASAPAFAMTPSFQFEYTELLGTMAGTEVQNAMFVGSRMIPAPTSYMYSRGRRYYEVKAGADKRTFTGPQVPFVETTLAVVGPNVTRLIRIPAVVDHDPMFI